MRRVLPLAAVVLAGCQTLPNWVPVPGKGSAENSIDQRETRSVRGVRHVVLNTQPAGGQILIESLGRQVKHGTSVELGYGSYQLRGTLTGYRSGRLQLQVDQQSDSMVVVPLGEGFARVTVSSDPPEAILSVDGNRLGKTPFSAEISADEHQFGVTFEGFEPSQKTVVIAPNGERKLHFELQSRVGLAALEIDTNPSGGLLRLDGRLVGHAPLTLTDMPPKQYQLTGELILGGRTRLIGKADLHLQRNQRRKISLQLSQRETLFSGIANAPSAEIAGPTTGFESDARPDIETEVIGVTDAFRVSVEMTDILRKDFSNPLFSGAVYGLLRAGDSIDFYQQQRGVGRLQKLADNSVHGLNDQLRKLGIVSVKSVSGSFTLQQQQRLSKFMFLVYEQRGSYPLLALAGDQLHQNKLEFRRQKSDAEIVILATGGELSVEGHRPVTRQQGISLFRLAAANGVVRVSWIEKPSQLLITAADSPGFESVQVPSVLELGQKKTLRPLDGWSVDWLQELTAGPGIRGWRGRQLSTFKPGSGVYLEPVIEIGPHQRSGEYQRTWVVGYRHRGGVSQRQLSLSYQVGSNRQVFVSDQ
ncbi:MAG: PEGA domain-containing protein, partial [Gammaproteobacteria bacterium]|nr:PEGA domain-containing protein [Gammaproteobacteria bacterium]